MISADTLQGNHKASFVMNLNLVSLMLKKKNMRNVCLHGSYKGISKMFSEKKRKYVFKITREPYGAPFPLLVFLGFSFIYGKGKSRRSV